VWRHGGADSDMGVATQRGGETGAAQDWAVETAREPAQSRAGVAEVRRRHGLHRRD
jgi:hypothetical protein